MLALALERDHIAGLAAAEAVERAGFREYLEGWPVILVEWAELRQATVEIKEK